jgi:hypothetical protein
VSEPVEIVQEACAAFELSGRGLDHAGFVRRTGLEPYGVEAEDRLIVTSEGTVDSLSVEEHIGLLLERLERAAPPRSLSARLLCYFEPRSDNAGFQLSAAVLGRVAALGAGLDVDIRWYDSDEEAEAAGTTATDRLLAGVAGQGESWAAKASFRLLGDNLHHAEVTRLTGIAPDTALEKGEPFGSLRRPVRTGIWGLESEGAVESSRLEPHIAYLLDRLGPVAGPLHEIRQRTHARADLFCMWGADGRGGGPSLSASSLARAAALDAALGLDIYTISEEDDA